jgi:hypothetical protein
MTAPMGISPFVESLLRLGQSLAHKLLVLFALFLCCHVAKVILFLESSK